LVIEFGGLPEGARAQVRLTVDESDVSILAFGGAATFTNEIGRVRVDGAGRGARFELRIPAAAPRVELRAGAASLFLVESGRVRPPVAVGPEGEYVVELTPGR
jgi:hypothetical protein